MKFYGLSNTLDNLLRVKIFEWNNTATKREIVFLALIFHALKMHQTLTHFRFQKFSMFPFFITSRFWFLRLRLQRSLCGCIYRKRYVPASHWSWKNHMFSKWHWHIRCWWYINRRFTRQSFSRCMLLARRCPAIGIRMSICKGKVAIWLCFRFFAHLNGSNNLQTDRPSKLSDGSCARLLLNLFDRIGKGETTIAKKIPSRGVMFEPWWWGKA